MNQRRDARRNRARIIAAAAEVFREDGAGAPLNLVAQRADVGRGTLYRHFADRGALIAAVLEMRMGALEQYAATYPGDDLVEHLAIAMFDGVISVQSQVPGDEPVERALTIVLRGLRSTARSELPVPRRSLHLPTV